MVEWVAGLSGVVGYDWHADRLAARYVYDAYGNIIGPDTDDDGDWTDDAGPFATANPFRFSTKYWDDETGLGSWIFRYYDPGMGRWISRDPIEEEGGSALYVYVDNDPVGINDPIGLKPKLWTSSGINNWQKGAFRNYVNEYLKLSSDEEFVSKIGSGPAYLPGGAAAAKGGVSATGIASEQVLDYEATGMARERKPGEFCRDGCEPTKVRVLLIAPKTTTIPMVDPKCCDIQVDILFSPWDNVPNQRGIFPDRTRSVLYWSKFAINGYAEGINTKLTFGYVPEGSYPNHHLRAFISETGELARLSKLGTGTPVVGPGLGMTPDAPSKVKSMLESDADYVFVGHSQGTNILEHVLNHVCNKGGIDINADGRPQEQVVNPDHHN